MLDPCQEFDEISNVLCVGTCSCICRVLKYYRKQHDGSGYRIAQNMPKKQSEGWPFTETEERDGGIYLPKMPRLLRR
jgi:hypothetical protein